MKHRNLVLVLLVVAFLVYCFARITDIALPSLNANNSAKAPGSTQGTRQGPNIVYVPSQELEDDVMEQNDPEPNLSDSGEDVIEYNLDWGIPLNPPPPGRGPLPVILQVPGFSDAMDLPDMEGSSDWDPLTCSITNGRLHLVIAGDHETWPTSPPKSGTAMCLFQDEGTEYQIMIELDEGEPIPW